MGRQRSGAPPPPPAVRPITRPPPPLPPLARLRAAGRACGRVLRTVLGAPDYERYVAHRRAHHAGEPLLDRAGFERERMAARYDRPGSRCC